MTDTRTAYYVDQQERAHEFQVGDVVIHTGQSPSRAGRVVAVWPAIGYVDVQWTWGPSREAVEELQILDPERVGVIPPRTEDIPGGAGTVSVSGGPPSKVVPATSIPRSAAEGIAADVAQEFANRKGIYWRSKDRRYRATKSEKDNGSYTCPKCRGNLRKAIFRRDKGISERLLGCQSCMFLVCEDHIEGILPFNRRSEPPPKVLPTPSHTTLLSLVRGGS